MTQITNRSKPTYAGEPLPEIKIFTHRLLSADTTEKVLNELIKIPHIRQMNIHGEYLPPKVKMGPNTGIDVNHPERKIVKFGNQEILLTNLVGSFFVEVESKDFVDQVLEGVTEVCEKLLPFGYNLDVGRYSKFKPTLTDYMRC